MSNRSNIGGLLETLDNPKSIMYRDNKIIIIKHKHPKSERHYLVVPYQDIWNLESYQQKMLIEYMTIKACEFIGTHPTRRKYW